MQSNPRPDFILPVPHSKRPVLFPTFCALLAIGCGVGALHAADPTSAELRAANAPENGLAVQIGARTPAFLTELTAGGKRLVQGLALDDATRDAILPALIKSGAHPFATVPVWASAPALPYADRLVTLLVVDLDELGPRAPTGPECQRVVQPGGTILYRKGGAWKTSVVARPTGLGDWTHFDGGADGNAVSTDTEATAMRGLQWIDNVREVRWAKSGPHGGEGGNIRILGRHAVIDMRIFPEDKDPKFDRRQVLECRDVNNGLLIWQKPRPDKVSAKRWALALGEGQCFTWLAADGPLTAIDLATGKELRTYPGSEIKPFLREEHGEGKPPKTEQGMHGDNHWVRVSGKTVVANGDGGLRAWTMDGKPLWSFARKGFRVETPIIDAAHGLVCALLIEDEILNKWGKGPISWGRWISSAKVDSLVALDLATGAVKWENTDVASRDTDIMLDEAKEPVRIEFGQILAAGDYIIAYNSRAIIGGKTQLIASIDAATGKTVHFDPMTFIATDKHGRTRSAGGLVAIARDGLVYTFQSFDIHSFNPKTGELKEVLNVAWNGRCQKPVATTTQFLLGQTAFIDKDFSGEMFAIARSGCAHSPVPAGGVVMFGPHTCACTTHLDGFLATTSHPAPAPFPDARRLVSRNATAAPALPAPAPAPAVESLVSQSWPWFVISEAPVPASEEKAGWTFQVEPQGHRLTATKGAASWSFVGDARLGGKFCVVGDRVVIGSHDGWVHGLDLATGTPRWRYFAASAQRQIVANGMLTSAWPVMGVADLGSGQIVASAGTHTELEGGIRIVGLDAATGREIWAKTLRKPASIIPPGGGRETKIADRSLINAAPAVEAGKIVIAGGTHLGRVEFAPDESEESIIARLVAPPAKKR